MWVLPANEPQPVEDAGPEKAPTKSIQVGTFGDEDLGDSKTERGAFNRLTESLKAFPELRVCLVVTIGTWSEDVDRDEADVVSEESATDKTEPVEPELLSQRVPADVPVLVEKWKNELMSQQKIGADHVTILFRTSPDYTGQMVDVWLVPPGQPLPDLEGKSDERPDEVPATIKPPELSRRK